MKTTFWAAYASRLYSLADRMEAVRTPEDAGAVLLANSDLWAALDADVRAGLVDGHAVEALDGTLLTRARTVAEQSRGAVAALSALVLLNRQTALALTGKEEDVVGAPDPTVSKVFSD